MNVLNWFDIPVTDMDRAVAFYSGVLGIEMHRGAMGGALMAFFPHDGVGGCLVQCQDHTPSAAGTLIYLNAGADLDVPLARVQPLGGKVLMPKCKITDEIGFMAVFLDTEGNRVGFHSPH